MMIDLGGTVRARSPADTLARLRPLLPRFGISRVMAQEGLGDIAIPVSISCRPNSRFVSTSQGKGITRELADISAIMESIEGYHAERVPSAVITASVAELAWAGHRAIGPRQLPHLPQLPIRSDDEPLEWLALEHLADRAPVLVPRRFICMDQTGQSGMGGEAATRGLFVTSNGLASGNTREEAIVHGLYELIERDCVYEHRYRRTAAEQRARRLAIDPLRELPHIAELVRRLDEANLQLAVSALHGRLGIPAFGAAVRSRALTDRAPSSGCGAHYVPEVALSRAITEAVQSRITYISGSRDDIFPWHYLDVAPLPELPGSEAPPALTLDDVPRPPRFASFTAVLAWTLDVLERHGLTETCYFDHQRPQHGDIPVVSVVCPGLALDFKVLHVARKDGAQ
jgi:ribosomal protein S12 methylthiotransferase accessory factor